MSRGGVGLIRRPEAAEELASAAERLLRSAGALGKLPTPVDELIATAGLAQAEDLDPFIRGFLSRLPAGERQIFLSGMQKLRGVADLREHAIYVSAETDSRRRLFVKAHELGHHVLPWHRVNMAYRDDPLSLSPDAQELFDQEANFFAAEVIFQGRRFTQRARAACCPSFISVLQLADEHGASRHATLWRYVEAQDEAVAAVAYWPSQHVQDAEGYPVLRKGKVVGSPRYLEQLAGVRLPGELRSGDVWLAARDHGNLCDGTLLLPCGRSRVRLHWEAWWNTYSLLVLLRRRPMLTAL